MTGVRGDEGSSVIPVDRSSHTLACPSCQRRGGTRDTDPSSYKPAAGWLRCRMGLRWPLYMTPFRHHPHVIDSRNHHAIKRIRRLHERAERDRTRFSYIEGMRFIARAVQHRVPIEALVACRLLLTHPFARHLVRQLRQAGMPILEVTPDVLFSVALVDDPQGIGAVVRQRWTPLEQIVPANGSCWIMLDTVRSPGNLGTILRSSEAVGGAGLILLGEAVDPYDPATVRASMGSLFSQRFVRTTVADVLRWKGRQQCVLVGTAPSAVTDYQEVDYRVPTVLLLGGERKGLSSELRALCDALSSASHGAGRRWAVTLCGHIHWPTPLATLPSGGQVLNVDARVVVLSQAV